ncbi:MAG: GNAT family N-acetyltransferase [Chloroflexota bacterium]|nr:GNAT family N-acetyltransferase [Chloroflexota bacterium]
MLARPYRAGDEAALLALWNATMHADPLNAATFRTKVLLDPNFRPEGLLLAEERGQLAGFVLVVYRQTPLFQQGLEPDLGWVWAFGVAEHWRRAGVGRQLIDAAMAHLAGAGRKRVLVSPYTPGYFVPGVDTDAYAGAVTFLKALGWRITSEPISMHVDLTGFFMPAHIKELEGRLAVEEGITVRSVQPADLVALPAFVVEHFGWDWYRLARENLVAMFGTGSGERGVWVAMRDDQVVAYCQHSRERFGPFGVDPALRGKGIGRVLLFRCLADMLAKGYHCAWFLWTSRRAAGLYAQAGFRTVRQFAIMERAVEATNGD